MGEKSNGDKIQEWIADKWDDFNWDDDKQMDPELRKRVLERAFPKSKEEVQQQSADQLAGVKQAVEKGKESKLELKDVKNDIARKLAESLKGRSLDLTGKLDKQSCQKRIFEILKGNGFDPGTVEDKDAYLNSLAFAMTAEVYKQQPGLEELYKANPEANFSGILALSISSYLEGDGINVEVKPDENFKANMVAFKSATEKLPADQAAEKPDGQKDAAKEVDPADDGLAQVMADFLVATPNDVINKFSEQEVKDFGSLKELVKGKLKLNFQAFLLKKNVPGAPNLEVLGVGQIEQEQTFNRIKPLIQDKLVASFLAPGGLIANGFGGYDLKAVEKINSGENKSDKLGYKVSFDGTNFSVVFTDQTEFDAAYKTASENVDQPALSVDANGLKKNFLVRFLAGFFGVKTDADWNEIADPNSGHPMQYLLGALSVVGGQEQFAAFGDKWTGLKEQYGDSQYLGGPIKYVEGMIATKFSKKKGGVMDLIGGAMDTLKKGPAYFTDLMNGKTDFVAVGEKAVELTEIFTAGDDKLITLKVPKGVEMALKSEVGSLVKVGGGAVDWKKIGEGVYKLAAIPKGSVLPKGVEIKIDNTTV